MSNSDSRSHFTTFSAPPPHSGMDSPSPTTPSPSRAASPAMALQVSAMDLDLFGIGDQIKPPIPGGLKDELPIQSRRDQQSEPCFSRDRSETPHHTVDLIVDPVMGIPIVQEGFPESEPEDEGFHLDLEKTASVALSRCFGVTLSRLARPIRVVDAFSGFRDQCAEILEDEEQFTTIDWDDDGLSCFDVDESPVEYAEYPYGMASNHTERTKPRTYKRPTAEQESDSDDFDNSDMPPDPERGPKARGRYKKRRIALDYSCPYRKRNPKRFNIRDHEACANVSYPNMNKLKVHVRAHHYKPSCPHCRQRFDSPPDLFRPDHTPEDCLVHRKTGAHLQQQDPEDGLDTQVEKLLVSRKPSARVENWHSLWRALFPEDQMVPSHEFEPLIEHHDAAADGCNDCVFDITNDVVSLMSGPFKLVDESQLDSSLHRALTDIIHKNVKILLKNSKYAIFDGCDMLEGSPMFPFKEMTEASAIPHDGDSPSGNGSSPNTVVTPESCSPDEGLIRLESGSADTASFPSAGTNQDSGHVQHYPQNSVGGILESLLPVGHEPSDMTPLILDNHGAFGRPDATQLHHGSNSAVLTDPFQNWTYPFVESPPSGPATREGAASLPFPWLSETVGSQPWNYDMVEHMSQE